MFPRALGFQDRNLTAWGGGGWGVSGMRQEKDLSWKSWEAVALAE